MTKNVKIILAYDGTAYLGWQDSIEFKLKAALEQILQEKIILQAAGRTDKGVHALGQVVNFITQKHPDLNKLQGQLNALLPKDIRALKVEQAHDSFHPTIDAIEKTYVYDISSHPLQMPGDRRYFWHVYTPLDIELMRQGAKSLIGTHNFEGFTNKKPKEAYSSHIRTIYEIAILETAQGKIRFTIKGDHFLYKMVRNIVGTLVFIGCKKLPIHVIQEVLQSKKRSKAGITAPAHGLTLMNIKYNRSLPLC